MVDSIAAQATNASSPHVLCACRGSAVGCVGGLVKAHRAGGTPQGARCAKAEEGVPVDFVAKLFPTARWRSSQPSTASQYWHCRRPAAPPLLLCLNESITVELFHAAAAL
eukprot:1568607-Prymnesium_polylepis.1